jgi:hypothetical protein
MLCSLGGGGGVPGSDGVGDMFYPRQPNCGFNKRCVISDELIECSNVHVASNSVRVETCLHI